MFLLLSLCVCVVFVCGLCEEAWHSESTLHAKHSTQQTLTRQAREQLRRRRRHRAPAPVLCGPKQVPQKAKGGVGHEPALVLLEPGLLRCQGVRFVEDSLGCGVRCVACARAVCGVVLHCVRRPGRRSLPWFLPPRIPPTLYSGDAMSSWPPQSQILRARESLAAICCVVDVHCGCKCVVV